MNEHECPLCNKHCLDCLCIKGDTFEGDFNQSLQYGYFHKNDSIEPWKKLYNDPKSTKDHNHPFFNYNFPENTTDDKP